MKRIFLIAILTFIHAHLFAQKAGRDGYIVLPKELDGYQKLSFMNNLYDGRKALSNLSYTTEKQWVIYSDRQNNPVYDRPNGRPIGSPLNFMEPLRVKAIQGDWINVFSGTLEDNGKFKNDVDRGWIQVKFVVLSSYAVLNERSAPKKAMALISLKSGQLEQDDIPKDLQKNYNLYFDPGKQQVKGISQKFIIRFILKETSTSKLLTNTDKLGNNALALKNNVAGWMANVHITEWDHRLCLEPASNTQAVDAYQGFSVPVFPTREQLERINTSGNIKGAILKNQLKTQIQSPYIMRLPVLENLGGRDDMKKVATVGRLGNDEVTSDEQANLKVEVNRLTKLQKNINILFVIDGTSSMTKFYQPVAQSISRIIRNNESIGLKANLKFGAVVYRDYPDGAEAVSIQPLTSNYSNVEDWLMRVVCKSSDKDLPEAQYYGISEGIKKAGFVEGQSNVVVLIGDAGNHVPDPKGLTLEKVVDGMSVYDLSFISFQVINGKDQSFADFNADSQDYIRGLAAKLKVKNGQKARLEKHNGIQNTFVLKIIGEGGQDVADIYRFGRFTYAQIETQMANSVLENNINDALTGYLSALNKKIESITSIIESGVQTEGKSITAQHYDESVVHYICTEMQESGKMTYNECVEFIGSLGEFSFVGYTNMTYNDKTTPCYDAVVFLSKDEFDQVLKTLNSFRMSGSIAEKRKALHTALLEQTKKMLGEVSDDNIENKSLNEIWEIILNIPFDSRRKYGALADTRLKEFLQLNDGNFDLFLRDYENKVRSFNPDKYRDRSFELAGQKFYWVPLKDFPGNG